MSPIAAEAGATGTAISLRGQITAAAPAQREKVKQAKDAKDAKQASFDTPSALRMPGSNP